MIRRMEILQCNNEHCQIKILHKDIISVHLNTKVKPLCDLKVKMMEKYMRWHTCVKIQDGRHKNPFDHM